MTNTNPYQPPESPSKSREAEALNREMDRTDDELVVLATFENAPEAHCLRAELESNGITATVGNEQSAQTVGASLFGRISAVWIEVLVLKSDAEAALAIKNRLDNEDGADSTIPEWTCECGATVDEGFGQCWSCLATYNQ